MVVKIDFLWENEVESSNYEHTQNEQVCPDLDLESLEQSILPCTVDLQTVVEVVEVGDTRHKLETFILIVTLISAYFLDVLCVWGGGLDPEIVCLFLYVIFHSMHRSGLGWHMVSRSRYTCP